jgi:hypothetical protein
LEIVATVANFATVQNEGVRQVIRDKIFVRYNIVKFYILPFTKGNV